MIVPVGSKQLLAVLGVLFSLALADVNLAPVHPCLAPVVDEQAVEYAADSGLLLSVDLNEDVLDVDRYVGHHYSLGALHGRQDILGELCSWYCTKTRGCVSFELENECGGSTDVWCHMFHTRVPSGGSSFSNYSAGDSTCRVTGRVPISNSGSTIPDYGWQPVPYSVCGNLLGETDVDSILSTGLVHTSVVDAVPLIPGNLTSRRVYLQTAAGRWVSTDGISVSTTSSLDSRTEWIIETNTSRILDQATGLCISTDGSALTDCALEPELQWVHIDERFISGLDELRLFRSSKFLQNSSELCLSCASTDGTTCGVSGCGAGAAVDEIVFIEVPVEGAADCQEVLRFGRCSPASVASLHLYCNSSAGTLGVGVDETAHALGTRSGTVHANNAIWHRNAMELSGGDYISFSGPTYMSSSNSTGALPFPISAGTSFTFAYRFLVESWSLGATTILLERGAADDGENSDYCRKPHWALGLNRVGQVMFSVRENYLADSFITVRSSDAIVPSTWTSIVVRWSAGGERIDMYVLSDGRLTTSSVEVLAPSGFNINVFDDAGDPINVRVPETIDRMYLSEYRQSSHYWSTAEVVAFLKQRPGYPSVTEDLRNAQASCYEPFCNDRGSSIQQLTLQTETCVCYNAADVGYWTGERCYECASNYGIDSNCTLIASPSPTPSPTPSALETPSPTPSPSVTVSFSPIPEAVRVDITKGLQLYYQFDEDDNGVFTTVDASVHGRSGTRTSDAQFHSNSKIGPSAMALIYSDPWTSYVTISDPYDVESQTSMQLTYAAWISMDSGMTGNAAALFGHSAAGSRWVFDEDHRFYAPLRAANGKTEIPMQQWVHVALTVDGSDVRFYVDGVNDLLPESTGLDMIHTVNLIGADELPVGDYFNGVVDDFRIYDRALSQAEVEFLAGWCVEGDYRVTANYDGTREHCYIYFDSESISWSEASDECAAIGAHLATVSTAEEQEVVRSLVAVAGSTVWVGSKRDSLDSGFYWVTGEARVLEDWHSSAGQSVGCLSIRPADGQFKDFSCSVLRPYVCEKESPQLPNCAFGTSQTLLMSSVRNISSWITEEDAQSIQGESAGICYELHDESVPYLQGEAECQGTGGHLASIMSADEDGIIELLDIDDDAFIGLNEIEEQFTYVWTSGQTPGYTNFFSSEPSRAVSNGEPEACGRKRKASGGGWWYDDLCSVLRPYICKRVQQSPEAVDTTLAMDLTPIPESLERLNNTTWRIVPVPPETYDGLSSGSVIVRSGVFNGQNERIYLEINSTHHAMEMVYALNSGSPHLKLRSVDAGGPVTPQFSASGEFISIGESYTIWLRVEMHNLHIRVVVDGELRLEGVHPFYLNFWPELITQVSVLNRNDSTLDVYRNPCGLSFVECDAVYCETGPLPVGSIVRVQGDSLPSSNSAFNFVMNNTDELMMHNFFRPSGNLFGYNSRRSALAGWDSEVSFPLSLDGGDEFDITFHVELEHYRVIVASPSVGVLHHVVAEYRNDRLPWEHMSNFMSQGFAGVARMWYAKPPC